MLQVISIGLELSGNENKFSIRLVLTQDSVL